MADFKIRFSGELGRNIEYDSGKMNYDRASKIFKISGKKDYFLSSRDVEYIFTNGILEVTFSETPTSKMILDGELKFYSNLEGAMNKFLFHGKISYPGGRILHDEIYIKRDLEDFNSIQTYLN